MAFIRVVLPVAVPPTTITFPPYSVSNQKYAKTLVLHRDLCIRSSGVNGSSLNFLMVKDDPLFVIYFPMDADILEPSSSVASTMGFEIDICLPTS